MSSFNDLDDWYDALQDSSNKNKNVITVLAGNKSDLEDDRSVPIAFGKRKAEELSCDFFIETSAHKDINSINSMFKQISTLIVKR